MILVLGEILFDIFPTYTRLGGAPFNFAYHLKHFGFPVRFISRIGKDKNGRSILKRIEAAGFDPRDIQIDSERPTGSVQVEVDRRGVPTFEIIPDVAYDHIAFLPETHSPLMVAAELVYFGTLVQRTYKGFQAMQRFLKRKSPGCLLFCDMNLRPHCYSDEVVLASLGLADVLKLNEEELQECRRITGKHQDGLGFIRKLMSDFSLDGVAVTKGDQGSELCTPEGCNPADPVRVDSLKDTVGAGDGYAAMLAAGTIKRWHPKKIVSMAAAFAARICTIEGAIPETPGFYEPTLSLMRNGE